MVISGAIRAILDDEGLDPTFPTEVEAEAEALAARPGLDDPALVDAEAIPFVTVDSLGARDLDQALHLERDGDGFRVRYAIADAAHYVRPGTALFAEALRRGTSVYLPGLTIPMLPRSLSEGAVSLNAGVPRRALLFDTRLDARGAVIETRLTRVRMRSRARLSFEDVQELLDRPHRSPLAGRDFTPSLELLPVVGRLRQLDADARQVVRFRREELRIRITGDVFTVTERTRHPVEGYNEQLSLLCNAEGGRLLCEALPPAAQGIFRVHPAPPPERLVELERQVAEIAVLHRLDERWLWRPSVPLAAWVDRLPSLATDRRLARIGRAVERQAVMVNVRSVFAIEPDGHYGVGATPYARFSAPMREIVGVFVHKEAVEVLGLAPRAPAAEDEALRAAVVASGNAARERQRRLTDLTNRRVIDQLLAPDLARPPTDRPRRPATVMGVTPSKIHVTLDDPPIDLKVYVRDAERALRTRLSTTPGGAALVDGENRPVIAVGDAIELRVVERDPARDRWVLEPLLSGDRTP